QNDVYQVLKRHLDRRRPFRCFVNPREPDQAILYRNVRGEMLAFNTVFATLFGTIGLGLIAGALVAARRLPKTSADPVPADQPWLARNDWASGIIRGSGGGLAAPVIAFVAFYWIVASAPLLYELPEIWRQTASNWKWTWLAFPIIGVLLVAAAIHQVIQSM